MSAEWPSWGDRQRFVFLRGSVCRERVLFRVGGPARSLHVLRGSKGRTVWVETPVGTDWPSAADFAGVGRVTGDPLEVSGSTCSTMDDVQYGVYIDTGASRLHPASVAGLAVGAMGCAVFGLYLRRWLRERELAG
jgi:hypothetical protein